MFLLIFSLGSIARAAGPSIDPAGSLQAVAFARYVASQRLPDGFGGSDPVGVIIEASLPGLYKSATLVAVRGVNERNDLQIVQVAGDGTVAEEVIDRYLSLREVFDAMPASSIAITPANYNFHFGGRVATGGSAAFMYHITPKKNRPAQISGDLWMDSDTGQEVMLAGSFSNAPAGVGRIDVVRDTKLFNGSPYGRVTHVSFTIPRLGRAELVITEAVLGARLMPRSE
jgi:hypothetical protein